MTCAFRSARKARSPASSPGDEAGCARGRAERSTGRQAAWDRALETRRPRGSSSPSEPLAEGLGDLHGPHLRPVERGALEQLHVGGGARPESRCTTRCRPEARLPGRRRCISLHDLCDDPAARRRRLPAPPRTARAWSRRRSRAFPARPPQLRRSPARRWPRSLRSANNASAALRIASFVALRSLILAKGSPQNYSRVTQRERGRIV